MVVRVDLTLPQLEGLVDKHFAAFQKFGRRTVEEAWLAGHYLNQAKARVAHGGWLGWLEKRGAQPRQAQMLMKLAGIEKRKVFAFETVQAALDSAKRPHAAATLTIRNPEPLMRVVKELDRVGDLLSGNLNLALWIHPKGGNGIALWTAAWSALCVYSDALAELSSESNEEDCQAVDALHQAALIMATRFYSEASRANKRGRAR